ncbi:MAG: GNAT family N-acetyltransferase [Candidatus Bipolaricaulota bacterium]|nr:GNAT family N-acetyltransferase [Candidatus Bipolaricaulota bacterium]
MLDLRSVDRTMIHAAFLEAFADYSMGPPAGLSEERLLLRMRKNAVDYDLSVAAYNDGRMIGFTLIGVDAWGGSLAAYDAGTGIVPAFRGQGLARRMLEHALPALQERGVERFVLEVLQTNEPAIKAYRKTGFETSRELRSFVADAAAFAEADPAAWNLHPIGLAQFEDVARDVDWLPSFENRISALRAIPGDVSLVGAFDGLTCVGAYAYSAPLRWLLSVVVARSQRRRGVGRALITHVAAGLPEGVTRLAALNVDGGDVGMQKFLTRLGFAPLVDQFEMQRLLR